MTFSKVQLRKGERVRILPLNHPKPLHVGFQPLTPDDANSDLWMRMARTVPGQGEEKAYFNEVFRLVSAWAGPAALPVAAPPRPEFGT